MTDERLEILSISVIVCPVFKFILLFFALWLEDVFLVDSLETVIFGTINLRPGAVVNYLVL